MKFKPRIVSVSASAVAALLLAPTALAQDADNAGDADTDNNPIVVDGDGADPMEITDRNHPDYIRCRSEPVIGSLARRRRICMTNAEWSEAGRAGNERSRRIVEGNQPGFLITEAPLGGGVNGPTGKEF